MSESEGDKCFNISFLKKGYEIQTIAFFQNKVRPNVEIGVARRSPEISPPHIVKYESTQESSIFESEKLHGKLVIFHLLFLRELAESISLWASSSPFIS